MSNYEGIFVTKADLTDEASQKLLSSIESEISKNGGRLENVEKWGKRHLAYSIKKSKEGIYYKLDFNILPEKLAELKRSYRLNEDILRSMIVKKGK